MKIADLIKELGKRRLSRTVALSTAAFAATVFTPSTHAEFVFSIFSGLSMVEDNDLRLHQPGADLTFHNVSYKTKDFKGPLYYGARLSYFLPKHSNWGFGLEFFHSKMYLET